MSRNRKSIMQEVLAAPPAQNELQEEARPAAAARDNFTTRRANALTENARMVKNPTLKLKPSECSIWPGNARDYNLLTEDRVRSLIDSILAENGNRIPVVVRRTAKGAEQPYELIIGTRRHWAVSWLNANHYPDIQLLATIEDLDDEAAFRLADVENREREDISDLERGLNYKTAVSTYYGGVQSRMAERIKLSQPMLSRYINLTELPQSIVSAFASPMDLHVRYADKLLPGIRNPSTRVAMEEAAKAIAAEQSFRQSGDEPAISGSEVVARLVKALNNRPRSVRKSLIQIGDAEIGRIEKDRATALTITLNPSDASCEEILHALRPLIENAKILKKGAKSG